MRQIGTVSTEELARRLADYLLTQGIRAQIEPGEGGWPVWVYDEDQLPRARLIFERYQANPQGAEFLQGGAVAERIRSEAIAREKQLRRQIVDVKSQWTNRSAATRPVTILLIVASVVVGFMTQFGEDRSDGGLIQRLSFVDYVRRGNYIEYFRVFGENSDLRRGEVWRLFTPMLIHFGPVHLLFNMLGLHSLGSVIEIRRGSLRFALLVLWLAGVSNSAQYWWSGPSFGGMSGVVFGLFGYVWIKSRFDPSSGMYIDPGSVTTMLFFLVLCMTGVLGPIANTAHITGLLAGVASAFVPLVRRRGKI